MAVDPSDVHDEIRADKERKRAYMSTLAARYNPDVLGGSRFLKGNEYFPIATKEQEDLIDPDCVASDGTDGAKSEVVGSDSEALEDLFDQMKKQHQGRYWAEENITLKCHNCR